MRACLSFRRAIAKLLRGSQCYRFPTLKKLDLMTGLISRCVKGARGGGRDGLDIQTPENKLEPVLLQAGTDRSRSEGLRARLSGKQTPWRDTWVVSDSPGAPKDSASPMVEIIQRDWHDSCSHRTCPRPPPSAGVTAGGRPGTGRGRTCSQEHLLRGCLSAGPDPGRERPPQLSSSGVYFSLGYRPAGWCLDEPPGPACSHPECRALLWLFAAPPSSVLRAGS